MSVRHDLLRLGDPLAERRVGEHREDLVGRGVVDELVAELHGRIMPGERLSSDRGPEGRSLVTNRCRYYLIAAAVG